MIVCLCIFQNGLNEQVSTTHGQRPFVFSCWFYITQIVTVTVTSFTMPPKRKDDYSTSAATGSGPKPKRSKPTFRTPSTETAQVSEPLPVKQLSSSNNRVVTLRTGASGRRGYRTQELAAASSSSNSTQANDAPNSYDQILPADHDNTGPEIQNDIPAVSKAQRKQKNTTTVRL